MKNNNRSSLRKHPFLLALRRWRRFGRRNDVSPRETSPAVKSEEKRMFSQATTALISTLFLYISLPLFCTTTTGNFQKLLSYAFYGGIVVRVPFHFFNTAAHFHLALVVVSISHFVTAAAKFSCCSSKKKCFLFFISLALDLQLCRPFSR